MGDLIHLPERRQRRSTGSAPALTSAYYVDLGDPFSYLVGERVERILGHADWRPAPARRGDGGRAHPVSRLIVPRATRAEAERAAAILRLPLSWPEDYGADCRGLHRAAAYAHQHGAGGPFALAALRLGFGGGFNLSDPLTVAEAAGAARVPVNACLDAAGDPRFDRRLDANHRELVDAGVLRRPAIRVGEHWFQGSQAVIEAAAMRSASAGNGRRPAG